MSTFEVIDNSSFGGGIVKMWTKGVPVEEDAKKQINNISTLPFIYKHIAVMPDCHVGKGATVGSVIPTKNAIIPAAVGVDIGCFSGDTLVPLLDGKNYQLKELAESKKEFYIWSCTDDGHIKAAKATAKKTRKNAELLKITLDNNEIIYCTLDHKFMLRDGTFKEAKDLKVNQSLMPFYSKIDKDGYTMIKQPYSGKWQRGHWIAARSGILGKIPSYKNDRTVIHHRNFTEIGGFGLHNHRQSVHGFNHSIKSIEKTNKKEDVYCLTVPDYANFALAAGVFVHNCGMAAMRTSLISKDLPENLKPLRGKIEHAVPHGRTKGGGKNDRGSWSSPPNLILTEWRKLEKDFKQIYEKYPHLEKQNHVMHLGTLGTGNHFIEICLDEEDRVWVMLHSGSRGIGNAIGRLFIEKAKKEMERWHIHLPDQDLSYLPEGSEYFDDYWNALKWAQNFARVNRDIMMKRVLEVMRTYKDLPGFTIEKKAINCHHNYVDKEHHFGNNVYITRKGAIRAREGDLGIIPGSMGAKSFIVKGLGNRDSFHSCSHGAGRKMSRTKAKKIISLDDHIKATEGVECRKDESVIDESPAAYKSIDDVMTAQTDLVEIQHTLKQILCVKG